MLGIVLILFVIFLVTAGAAAGLALLIQGMLYTEPVDGVAWRAPAAGAALTAVLAVWVVLDYRAVRAQPSDVRPYGTLLDFSPWHEPPPFAELRVPRPGVTDDGQLKDDANVLVYRLEKVSVGGRVVQAYRRGGEPMPQRPAKVVVLEGGERVVFAPDVDAAGNFKTAPGRPLAYRDGRGRVMSETSLGRVSSFRTGLFVGTVLLNGVYLAAWFLCSWLLLRFQIAHAVVMALGMWALMVLVVIPPVLEYAEDTARASAAPARAAGNHPSSAPKWHDMVARGNAPGLRDAPS